MSFCKKFTELFIKPDQKSLDWDSKVFEYTDKKDFEELNKHLCTADELYLKENQICTAINTFTLETETKDKKQKLLQILKTEDFVDDLKYNDKTIKIKMTDGTEIRATKLTGLIPFLEDEDGDIVNESRKGQCHSKSMKISRSLGMDNNVVTGYIYGLSDKAKYTHSWVEFELKGEEVVIDYTLNVLMNKEGYYYMQHAQPVSKISDKDLVSDLDVINKIKEVGTFDMKEYLIFRDEIIRDFQKNKSLFDIER